jgi:hypothetical protein|nr:MAG TPA: hypothetical protein [Caudoviricetes sp.]
MLYISVASGELFDEATYSFIQVKPTVIQLEHSLLSISKWESKWKKPFMGTKLTADEYLDYVRCMTINKNVDPNIYYKLTAADYKTIEEYIHDPMTATTFNSQRANKSYKKQVITSELVYYWMVTANIPFEAERWHFNRLMTLIRVYEVKNDSSKMSKKDMYKSNRAINEARKAKYNSKG